MPSGVYKRTRQHIKKAGKNSGLARRGNKFSEKHKNALGKALSKIMKGNKYALGYHHTKEIRKKLSESLRGEKSHLWRGGITSENQKIRQGIEFRLWRESVFARDNWICQKTGIKGGDLHSHHILNFAQYPELRFAIDNGITLSKKAHREFHKKYGIKNNTKEQLEEFLLE